MQKTKIFKSMQTVQQFQSNQSNIDGLINQFVRESHVESFVIDTFNTNIVEMKNTKYVLSTAIIRYE